MFRTREKVFSSYSDQLSAPVYDPFKISLRDFNCQIAVKYMYIRRSVQAFYNLYK